MGQTLKVLQVTGGFRSGVSGGIASVLNNYCTAPSITDEPVSFDYLSLGYQTFEPYRQNLERGGGKLYCLNIHSHGKCRLFDIYIGVRRFLSEHEYDIIHANSGALTQLLVICLAAKSKNVKVIIAHSHNALLKSKCKQIMYDCLKPILCMTADSYFACSELAARSMFTRRVLKKKEWHYIPNALSLERFIFTESTRVAYRRELGIEGKFAVGHVGRFNQQKNHLFILDVFKEVALVRDNAVLVLVGNGDLQEAIKTRAQEYGIINKVLFLCQRSDVGNIMQALDCFIFPSLYEGLGMVLIEAQISGLKVIASKNVPIKETTVTDRITYLPLIKSLWVSHILDFDPIYERFSDVDAFIQSGFEINEAAMKLIKLYNKLMLTNCVEK